MQPVRVSAAADGSFVFANVGPGEYVVQAEGVSINVGPTGTRSAGARLFATSFVTVSADDPPPVQLRLSQGATLRGRVSYEGVPPGPPPILTLVALAADRDRGPREERSSLGFSIQPDGSFEYQGVFGPALLHAQPQRSDWYLKSVVFKGQDLTDSPFDFGAAGTFSDIDVVISAFGATTTGRVTDDRGAAVRDYAVIVFSTFGDRWMNRSRSVKTARPTEDGAFRVGGLPPGDYWVAAVDRLENPAAGIPEPPEPDLLEALSSRAVRITLGEGQSQDLTLRLIRR
jgi:hypothetical protein